MKLRRLFGGQGWVEAQPGRLAAIRDAIVSDTPETVIGLDGRVRVHRLEPFPPKPEVERVNLSGEMDVTPVGAVRRRPR